MPNYLLTILGSNCFFDETGTPLANGMLMVQPSAGFELGGGGLAVPRILACEIVEGSLTSTLQLANPAYTTPQGITYDFTVTDADSGASTVFRAVAISDDGSGRWDLATLGGASPVAPPAATPGVLADTATGTLFRIALVGNALTPVAYSGSASAAPLLLTDTITGIVYAVSVVNGALTWTAAPGSTGRASLAITDDSTGTTYALAMTNDTLTWA